MKIDHEVLDRVEVEGSPVEIAGLIEWIERELHVADQVQVTTVDAGPGQLRLTVTLDRVQGHKLAGKLHVMAACGDLLTMDGPTVQWLADGSIAWLEANGQSLAGSERARLREGLRAGVLDVDSEHCRYCGGERMGLVPPAGQPYVCWPLCKPAREAAAGGKGGAR